MTAQPGAVPQQQWMAKPQSIPGCPPGLEYLAQVDQLLVKQQVELLEGKLDCSIYYPCPRVIRISKKSKIRNRSNQVIHLPQYTTWESVKTQENITYKRTKWLAFSQQVTTRLQ